MASAQKSKTQTSRAQKSRVWCICKELENPVCDGGPGICKELGLGSHLDSFPMFSGALTSFSNSSSVLTLPKISSLHPIGLEPNKTLRPHPFLEPFLVRSNLVNTREKIYETVALSTNMGVI